MLDVQKLLSNKISTWMDNIRLPSHPIVKAESITKKKQLRSKDNSSKKISPKPHVAVNYLFTFSMGTFGN